MTSEAGGAAPEQSDGAPAHETDRCPACDAPSGSRAIDAGALAGLAHPLRVQLLEQLTVHGSATASDLARRLGESSGATSYHLRQLERHGFVEEDSSRGSRRERWWRAVRQRTRLRESDFADDPVLLEAHRLVVDELQRGRERRHHHWLAARRDWPLPWREAMSGSTTHFVVSVDEAAQLSAELQEVISRWAERMSSRGDPNDADGTRIVEVQVNAFPTGDPPAEGS